MVHDATYIRVNPTFPYKDQNGFLLNTTLTKNLDDLIRAVELKWDAWGIITGPEGSGKTTLTSQIASYLDPHNFSLPSVVFLPQEFDTQADIPRVKHAIQWDEAILGAYSGDGSTTIQKNLIKKSTIMRQKRKFVLLIIADLWDFKYRFIKRARFMIETYSPDGIHRGLFRFYSRKRMSLLYQKGKTTRDMNAIPPNFTGNFIDTEGFFWNEEEYTHKKINAEKKISTTLDPKNIALSQIRKNYKEKITYLIYAWIEHYLSTHSESSFREAARAFITQHGKKIKSTPESLYYHYQKAQNLIDLEETTEEDITEEMEE